MATVRISSNASRYGQDISIRQFQLTADEPTALGGNDAGPTPVELLLAALGSCKAITIEMYAERKGWQLDKVAIDLNYNAQTQPPSIQVALQLTGNLDESQRQRLQEISDRCPVHRLLTHPLEIYTQLS